MRIGGSCGWVVEKKMVQDDQRDASKEFLLWGSNLPLLRVVIFSTHTLYNFTIGILGTSIIRDDTLQIHNSADLLFILRSI
jgi:hypothetical protein